jgi:hypothetical protein
LDSSVTCLLRTDLRFGVSLYLYKWICDTLLPPTFTFSHRTSEIKPQARCQCTQVGRPFRSSPEAARGIPLLTPPCLGSQSDRWECTACLVASLVSITAATDTPFLPHFPPTLTTFAFISISFESLLILTVSYSFLEEQFLSFLPIYILHE